MKDYRFEVDESRMSDECDKYLVQLQKAWERKRMSRSVEIAQAEREEIERFHQRQLEQSGQISTRSDSPVGSVSSHSIAASEKSAVEQMVDEAFSTPSLYTQYKPPPGAECMGELLDSRYMVSEAWVAHPWYTD